MSHRIYDTGDQGNTVVWVWFPQPDITPYELAQCLPIFSTRVDSGTKGHSIGKLPVNVQRHFSREG
jgi:hypothetical protein